MKYTDIKEGDTIRILCIPNRWNSALKNSSPMKIKYPYEGFVHKIGTRGWPYAAHIGNYGFALDELINFEIVSINYEIY